MAERVNFVPSLRLLDTKAVGFGNPPLRASVPTCGCRNYGFVRCGNLFNVILFTV